MSSLCSWPGVRRWTCGSTKAGSRWRPWPSTTCAPSGTAAAPGAVSSAIRPSRTTTSCDAVDPLAGVEDAGAADDEVRRAGGRGRDEQHRHASWGSGSDGPGLAGAGEDLVEDRHADHDPGLDLGGDERTGASRPPRRESSTPRLTGPGCMSSWRGEQAPAVDAVDAGVLAQRGDEGLLHPLVLHPQRVDDVGRAQAVEREAHVAAERLDVARDQRRRPADRHVGAHLLEGQDVGPRDPAVQDVADDPDARAVDVAQAAAQRVDVEQGLRRVLVLAVAGVDDRRRRPAADELGGAGPRRADDDRVGLVGAQREDGVLQRLALLDARAAGREVRRRRRSGAWPPARRSCGSACWPRRRGSARCGRAARAPS